MKKNESNYNYIFYSLQNPEKHIFMMKTKEIMMKINEIVMKLWFKAWCDQVSAIHMELRWMLVNKHKKQSKES